jgi:glycine cleavage system aminomethyltransferase T
LREKASRQSDDDHLVAGTLKKMIALASIETGYSKPGTSLQMEVTIEAIRLKTNVKVATLPFFNPARKTAAPIL